MKKKNVKQLLSALLVIAMMASLLIVPAAAADKTGAVGDKWDFSTFKDTTTYPTTGDTTYDGLTLHNVGAHDNGYANFNSGGTITVPVAGPCNVEVQCQYGAGGTVGVGEDTVALAGSNSAVEAAVYSYAGPGAGQVTITRTSSSENVYVRSIEIKAYAKDPEVVADDEVVVKAGATGTLTVSTKNTEGKEVTWVYDVDEDTVVTNVASTEAGKVTFKAEKVGVAVITLTATVEEQQYSKKVTVYVQPTEMKELTDGLTLDFTASDGKATYLTNEYVTWTGGSYNGSHGIQDPTGMTVKVPAGKKANLKITTCQFNNGGAITIEGVTPTTSMDGSDPVYTFNGVTGEVNATITKTIYIHKIEVEVMDESAATLTLDSASVTMRAKESKEVTATATGYDEGMKLFVVSEDEKIATATVGEDGKTITITGVDAGKTTVYATMAAAQPTLEAVKAEDSGAKTVEVTVEEALAEGVKVWDFRVDSADALTAAMEGLISGAGTASKPAQYHGTTYGVYFYVGNTIDIPVDGPSTITVTGGYEWHFGLGNQVNADVYGTASGKEGNGSKTGDEVFTYTGGKGYARLTSMGPNTSYVAAIKVEPLAEDFAPNAVDVWDFGAEQMDESLFVNKLTVEEINSWYPEETKVGEPGANLASFKSETGIGFNDGGYTTTHRLRTSNESITRWDTQTKLGAEGADPYTSEVTLDDAGAVKGGKTYTGLVYSNKEGDKNVNLTLEAKAGDKITFVSGSNGKAATYSFADAEGTVLGTGEYAPEGSVNAMPLTFFAPADGTYTYYTENEKLVVCRIYRESGVKTTVSGTVDTTAAPGIADTFSVVFTGPGGVVTKAEVKDGKYTAELNNYLAGAEYTVSLEGADGFVVATGDALTLEPTDRDVDHPVVVAAVDLVKVTGKVTGLAEADLANLVIEVTKPEDKIFLPKIVPAADGAYETSFEKGVEYTLTAHNVNDYTLTKTSVSYTADGTEDVVFEAKPTYTVTMAPDPETVDLSAATITFTNVDEVDDAHPDGYIYTFTGDAGIKLRDAQYVVKVEGISAIQKLTPDLVISGANNTCTVPFQVETPTLWDFSDPTWTDTDAAKNNAYNGLVLSGIQQNKTYALGNADSTIQIPVDGPCAVTVTYCYAADGIIGDVPFSTTSGSTSTFESATYTYTGEAGTVELKTNSTTYITKIEVIKSVPYKETVTVGADKDYQTINEALAAVKQMTRTAEQRVTIAIDPGDYQEMLRVDVANVTLKNASATPSLELTNKGVDIAPNAVRITHYYGHGYAYYSMEKDCTYSAERLAVNKANGRLSFENPGTGTTSGSYWNATVSVMASGFQAEGIIFENSFNQYVSELAAQDVIVPLAGAKEGAVPRAEMKAGDTTVQEKAYVERAAALAIYNNCSKIFFDNCKFIGRQDTLYGGTGTTVGFYDCAIYGGTDYIFGGMNAVFAKCDLVFNTSEDKNDVGYITAPQQGSGQRGYLMYNCHVTSTTPGVDTASTKVSKPGTFGRPWAANTGEAVFYATDVDHTDPSYYTGDTAKGTSMIQGTGWLDSLSGKSALCGDFGTVEYYEGADTSGDRVTWAGKFTEAKTADGASMTDTAAWLGGWDAFAGKDMTVKNQTPKAFSAEVLKDELKAAIEAAKETYQVAADTEGLVVADDVTAADVERGQKFVNQKDMDAFKAAIDAAKAVYEEAGATAADVLKAQKDLAAAVTAFADAQQTGTKAPDASALTKALTDADAAKKDVAVSAGPASQVEKGKKFAPKAAMDALNEAIRQAQVVANSVAATQADVDAAAKALTDAIAAFNAAVETGTNEGGTVEPTEPTLTVTPATLDLKVGGTGTLTATLTNSTDAITWASDNAEVATVAGEGATATVTAVAAGEANITATAGTLTATVKVTVTDEGGDQPGPDVPEEIAITINTSKITVRKTETLRYTLTPADAVYGTIYWVSDDTDVLSVTAGGQATGVKTGKTNVTAYVLKAAADGLTEDNILAEATREIQVVSATTIGGGGSTTGQTTTPATTTNKTNSNGDAVKTETKSNGDKTVTVTDKDGNVIAKLEIPAHADLGYKFEDVPDNHWAEPSIQAMAAMKVFQGVSSTRHIFDMNSTVTRGTMAQILFNLSQGKAGINNPFTDAQGNWYSDAVAWAASVGVVTGVSDTNFAPNDSITREQLITMLYRYAQLLALDTNVTADMGKFVDADEIDSWASAAMTWAVGKGLIIGKGAGNLDPKAAASRAEAAVIIDRFLQMV